MSLYLGENLISGSKPINLGVRNIGELVYSSLPLTDAGLHLLDGSLILGGGIYQGFVDYIAELYVENPSANYFTTEALWQSSVSTYDVCGKFVYDSTNNTVRLPKVTGIIEGTTDLTALGDLVEAGLPNITGTFGTVNTYGLQGGTGVFSLSAQGNNMPANVSGSGYASASFDASRSSSIYGNSTTVQPQTIKAFYYIVIATSTKTEIQVDIDQVATDLNGKADVDLSNMSAGQSAKNEIISWGMPDWNNKITITSVPYTAPCAGIVSLYNGKTSAWPGISISVNGREQTLFNPGYNTTWNLSGYVIVDKNDIVTSSNFVVATDVCYFVPMKGAN